MDEQSPKALSIYLQDYEGAILLLIYKSKVIYNIIQTRFNNIIHV